MTARIIRLLDLLLAGAGIIALSPLLVLAILVLRFTGEGEVFYRQWRVGRDGMMFRLLKFATMTKNAMDIGAGPLTLRDDFRVLPVGRILRKTKINELPQLFNVIAGQMSIMGPRPQPLPHFEAYSTDVQQMLSTVRPGLSGIASIVFRDEEKVLASSPAHEELYARIIAPYKGELECWYVRRMCLRVYITLILLTLWCVVFPRSRLHHKVFPGLPPPPLELQGI